MKEKLLLIGIIFLCFVQFFHPLTALNQDLARHIVLGKIIITSQSVPKENLFSYTYPSFPFINSHWLSEVIFYGLFAVSGSVGIGFFGVLLGMLAFGIVLVTAHKQKAHIFALFAVSLLALGIIFERTDPRPELFSFLFTALFVTILYYSKRNHTKTILLLIPAQLLWANMHIYFPIGIGFVGIFLLDNLFTNYQVIIKKRILPKDTILLFITLIGSLAVTFINPNGITGALYPLFVFNNYGVVLQENQNIFYAQAHFFLPAIVYFEIASFLFFVLLLLNRKKASLADWLIAVSFTIIGAQAVRNMPLFAFASFIPFSRFLSMTVERIRLHKKAIFFLYIAGCVALLWNMWFVVSVQGFGLTSATYPKNGADFLQKNNIKGPIFNNFDTGSYLIYRFYPVEKVFVDERPEAYPSSFFSSVYGPMQSDYTVFKQEESKYNFNVVFYEYGINPNYNPILFTSLLHDPSWKLVYLDAYVIIFIKDTTLNKRVIDAYAISESTYTIPRATEKELFNFGLFFSRINWQSKEINVLEKIAEIDQSNCIALSRLAYYAQSQSSLAPYVNQYNTMCK